MLGAVECWAASLASTHSMPGASFDAVVTTRTVPRCCQVSPVGIELSMVEMHWFWLLVRGSHRGHQGGTGSRHSWGAKKVFLAPWTGSEVVHFYRSECDIPGAPGDLNLGVWDTFHGVLFSAHGRNLLPVHAFFFFPPHHVTYRILVSWPGKFSWSPVVEAWIPNHWITREFPCMPLSWLYLQRLYNLLSNKVILIGTGS